MDNQQRDRDLKELFAELRSEEARRTPDFDGLMERVWAESETDLRASDDLAGKQSGGDVRGRRRWRPWAGLGVLAAAAIASIILVQNQPTSESEFEELVRAFSSDPALGAWKSPTDGLLNLPGQEIVTTIPAVGTTNALRGMGFGLRQDL